MRELSVAEQRYQAVLAVIKDGRTVTEVAAAVGVSRQTLHTWLGKYEAGGLEGLVNVSHRPVPGLMEVVCPCFHGVWISGVWWLTSGRTSGTTGLLGGVST